MAGAAMRKTMAAARKRIPGHSEIARQIGPTRPCRQHGRKSMHGDNFYLFETLEIASILASVEEKHF
jgi:hypothetical protein